MISILIKEKHISICNIFPFMYGWVLPNCSCLLELFTLKHSARHSVCVFISEITLASGTGDLWLQDRRDEYTWEKAFCFSSLPPFPLQCSTTCGLGAYWRSVECSTGMNADCADIQRPDPAKKCHLRPCAGWRVGNWSKVTNEAVSSGKGLGLV